MILLPCFHKIATAREIKKKIKIIKITYLYLIKLSRYGWFKPGKKLNAVGCKEKVGLRRFRKFVSLAQSGIGYWSLF